MLLRVGVLHTAFVVLMRSFVPSYMLITVLPETTWNAAAAASSARNAIVGGCARGGAAAGLPQEQLFPLPQDSCGRSFVPGRCHSESAQRVSSWPAVR